MKNINAIRMLSIDMIEKSQSGHPGICMGAAPIMSSLFAKHLKIYNQESNWFNRDRFILAAGHGSAMLYATLHLSGYDLSIEDLKEFRALDSKTPGHPEIGHTDGVDSTSGPLGQGIAQGVGFAFAQKHLAAKFNQPNLDLINHYTYILCGDGDLQEGISHEASSLAGHLEINKLILIWDSNNVQLDSRTENATSEDVHARYSSYGWETLTVLDGNDRTEIDRAIKTAKASLKPVLIEVKTVIGYGSPNKGNSPEAHGAPLGEDEVKLVRENYNWNNQPFEVDKAIYEEFQKNSFENGKKEFENWEQIVLDYKRKFPEKYQEFKTSISGDFSNLELIDYEFNFSEATRVSSGKAINSINQQIPNLIGGSADLSKSNNSNIAREEFFTAEHFEGKNIAFGVREFAMAGITNGINLHGGLKTFCSTFFVFSDYLKPAIRMSALQGVPNIYVLTHDSVAVGEDGPTHQPIEQLSGLRAMPNLNVFRPCDANEVQYAWKYALNSQKTPSALILSRQNIEVVTSKQNLQENFEKGAYILEEDQKVEKIIIATGSEVGLALKVKNILNQKNIGVRVISMPCMELFNEQEQKYKQEIFFGVDRENIYFFEMATAAEGYQYAGNVIGIQSFGASGEGQSVIDKFGFNAEVLAEKISK